MATRSLMLRFIFTLLLVAHLSYQQAKQESAKTKEQQASCYYKNVEVDRKKYHVYSDVRFNCIRGEYFAFVETDASKCCRPLQIKMIVPEGDSAQCQDSCNHVHIVSYNGREGPKPPEVMQHFYYPKGAGNCCKTNELPDRKGKCVRMDSLKLLKPDSDGIVKFNGRQTADEGNKFHGFRVFRGRVDGGSEFRLSRMFKYGSGGKLLSSFLIFYPQLWGNLAH